jgi:taurine dioxygenase
MTTSLTPHSQRFASRHFGLRPLAGRIGAEILNLDLKASLGDDTIQDIRKALIFYKVIFFRFQAISEAEQISLAQRFGKLTTAHPTVPSLVNHSEILDLDYGRNVNRANYWHTDVTFVDKPPLGSLLRAVEIPPVGGDTIWANTVTAYQDLPGPLQRLADELWAVHSNAYDYATGAVNLSEAFVAYRQTFESTVFETLHPVVHVHPESQERALLLGGFVRRFQGLSQSESDDLLRIFQSYVTRPENTVRWQWQVGDVAFWDNRTTQHYATDDFDNQPRRVQRVTIAGEFPISISGQRSQAIKGDSTSYNQSEILA